MPKRKDEYRILDYDFYYLQVVPLYCACLIELDKPGELYYLAHKLVTANPSMAVAWFAVVFPVPVRYRRALTTS